MRMLLRAVLPNETANAAVRKGTLGSTIQKILADLKPEAAYFVASDGGERCAVVVFDMKESSELPKVAEPWFLAFNATTCRSDVGTTTRSPCKASPIFRLA